MPGANRSRGAGGAQRSEDNRGAGGDKPQPPQGNYSLGENQGRSGVGKLKFSLVTQESREW